MPETAPSTGDEISPDDLPPITKDDLIDFWCGECDDEMHARIAYHLNERPDSPITKWFEMMQRKAANPASIDWRAIGLSGTMETEQQNDKSERRPKEEAE